MSDSKRIIKNSIFLYIRMLLLMAIGFYTTRVILEALGIEDLGIYNVVGSLVLMFDFVSSGLTGATQRFLNIGIGKKNFALTNQYFSQSFYLHILFTIILILLLETIGLWFVENKLIIPESRLNAAIFVFHLSTLSLALRIIRICFESVIIAHEKMSIYAYLSIFEAVSKLLICFAVIYYAEFDKLILYAFFLMLVNLLLTAFNIIYCLIKYSETKVKWFYDRCLYRELLSFIGLNSWGVVAWALGKQGINIIINMFFGPIVNGAKSIASNLERVVIQFGSNMELAVRPQITKLYAEDKSEEMVNLGMKSTKFIFYVMLIISIPFLFQTEGILNIWLKSNPPYTIALVRIMIIESLVYGIGSNFYNVILATGNIKKVQIIGRIITLSSLPLSYIIIQVWHNEYVPSLVLAFTSLLYSLYIVYDANQKLKFGINVFYKKVYTPIIIVSVISILGCVLLNLLELDFPLFISCIFKSLILCLYTILVILLLGINPKERIYLYNLVKKKLR